MWYVGLNGPLACNINLYQVTNVTYVLRLGIRALWRPSFVGSYWYCLSSFLGRYLVIVCDLLFFGCQINALASLVSILSLSISISEKTLGSRFLFRPSCRV